MTSKAKWLRVRGGLGRRGVSDAPDHSLLREAAKITLKMQVNEESWVHVGSGLSKVHEGKPLRLNARAAGRPVIPGSTLKGSTAHYFTAIVGDMTETSRLFGWPGYMSRALFSDAYPYREPERIEVGPSWKPRRSFGGIKVYLPDLPFNPTKGGSYGYVEAFPPGTRFDIEVTVLNPVSRSRELSKLLLAMGYSPVGIGTFLLGFGRPKGLGKVSIIEGSVRISSIDPLGRESDVTSDILTELEDLWNSPEGDKIRENFREVFGIG